MAVKKKKRPAEKYDYRTCLCPFLCMDDFSLTGMNFSPTHRQCFSLLVRGDLTLFDLIRIPVSGDIGGRRPSRFVGLLPKTHKHCF